MIGLALLLLAPSARGQFPVIEAILVEPHVGRSGSEFPLAVTGGNHLDGVDRLIFSDPRIVARPQTETTAEGEETIKAGHFTVGIADEVPAGTYEVFAVGAYGISNPRSFTVTSLPVTAPGNVGASVAEATTIGGSTPAGAEGAADGFVIRHQATAARVDYFRLTAVGGPPQRIRLMAQRVDSRMIGQLKLYGPDGREAQTARGADGFDPELTLPAGAQGDYVIAVQDFLFRGGANFFYHLEVSPIADSDTAAPIAISLDPSEGQVPQFAAIESATLPRLDSAVEPVTVEESVVVVTPPAVIESRFSRPRFGVAGSRSVVHFEAEEGRRLRAEVISQRLGEPTDPRLSIERREVTDDGTERWNPVLSEDDPPVVGDAVFRLRSKDPLALFTAPATATYRIKISNLDSGQSLAAEPKWLLHLTDVTPDFDLVALPVFPHNDPLQTRPRGSQVIRGDRQAIRVLAFRRDGFSGPIELSLRPTEGEFPAGVDAPPVVIASDQTETQLLISADENAAAWIGGVKVFGEGTDGERSIERTARPATTVWGRGDLRDTFSSRLSTELMVSVSDESLSPVSIRLGEGELTGKPGSDLAVPIRLVRRDAAAPVIVRPRGLPAGVTAAEVTIAGDQTEGVLTLKIAADAKVDRYSFSVLAQTNIQFKPVTQTDASEITVFLNSNPANLELTQTP